MPTLPDWAVQVLQVVSILVLAPLVGGIVSAPLSIVLLYATGTHVLGGSCIPSFARFVVDRPTMPGGRAPA